MRHYISLTAIILISLSMLTACQKPAAPVSVTADNAPRISLEEAKKDFDAGGVIFIDTRGAASFKQEHIKGAINISSDIFEAKYKEIPPDHKIIAYCS